jgi:hypothetical protein
MIISARNEHHHRRIVPDIDDPVKPEPGGGFRKNDVSGDDLIRRGTLNGDIRSRPNRGQHARSLRAEPQLARSAQALDRKIQYQLVTPGVCHLLYCKMRHSRRPRVWRGRFNPLLIEARLR